MYISGDVKKNIKHELIPLMENDGFRENYSETLLVVIDAYNRIFNRDDVHRSIISCLKHMVKTKEETTVTETLILQDIITLLLTPMVVTFDQYYYLTYDSNKKNVKKPLKLTYPDTTRAIVTLEDELDIIFNKIGMKGAIKILKLLAIISHD